MENSSNVYQDFASRFVLGVIARCKKDTGFAANLRHGDNPHLQSRAWPILASYGVNVENTGQCLAYAIIGANLARVKPNVDDKRSFGNALFQLYGTDGMDKGEAKLRRILSCESVVELCRMLRPVFRLMQSRGIMFNHTEMVNNIAYFATSNDAQEKIKRKWTSDFYNRKGSEDVS